MATSHMQATSGVAVLSHWDEAFFPDHIRADASEPLLVSPGRRRPRAQLDNPAFQPLISPIRDAAVFKTWGSAVADDYSPPSDLPPMKPHGTIAVVLKHDKGESIVSMPVEHCRSWEVFCNWVVRHDVQGFSYIKNRQFVGRLEEEDSNKLLFGAKWEEWVYSLGYPSGPQPRVGLCIVRDFCCEKPTENNGFCENCQVQFLEDEPLEADALGSRQPLVAKSTRESSPISTSLSTASPVNLGIEEKNGVNALGSRQPHVVSSSSSGVRSPTKLGVEEEYGVVERTDIPRIQSVFIPSVQNSVVRRRKLLPQPAAHTYPPNRDTSVPPVPEDDPAHKAPEHLRMGATDVSRQLGRIIRKYISTLYIFMIAPPFIYDEATVWNPELFERNLDGLKNWGWSANVAMSA
ncbi:hypothetical protein B0H16DRAFT_1735113 [Mycena metata]|uniref:Uncharacterized protein n=1 Tax=Mycena metata TaxID=1033252 RepID=A0AAD7HGZ3_9AGAR|nr:hypothetical protein B0H16DRAFT_1738877 [Mycena metata]KAJ7727454.1 hypothetical protein B0H16DRAFT_1735113 [Mycena metata]